jgi:hypothetical protein
MTAITVKGLGALQRKLAAASAAEPIKDALRGEAEAIAAEARARAPSGLAGTIDRHGRAGRPIDRVRHRAARGNALALADLPRSFTRR